MVGKAAVLAIACSIVGFSRRVAAPQGHHGRLQVPMHRQPGRDVLELRQRGQLAEPEEVGDLFEAHDLGEVRDHVSAVDEPAVLPVHEADLRLGGDYAFQAGDVFAHSTSVVSGLPMGPRPAARQAAESRLWCRFGPHRRLNMDNPPVRC
jgi:hypothetical protein